MTTQTHDAQRRAVLCAGLAESPVAPGPLALDQSTMTWVTANKLSGLLAVAVDTGVLTAAPDLDVAAAEQHALAMARDLVLERVLLETVAVLRAAGVEPCVLKGAAIAHLDYPDPAWRSFSDVDLLVRGGDYDRAVHALVGAGHERLFPEPRPGFDRRFGKGTVLRSPTGHEIDLHRTLAKGPYGLLLDLDGLWANLDRFEIGGVSISALSAPARTLHAAFQVALDGIHRRVGAVRDLATMLEDPHLDRAALYRLTNASGADAVLRRALEVLEQELGVHPLPAPTTAPRRRDRRWLALYDDPDSTYAALTVAAVRALPRVRDKLALVAALVAPRGAYLEQRHASQYQRLRHNLGGMIRGLRR